MAHLSTSASLTSMCHCAQFHGLDRGHFQGLVYARQLDNFTNWAGVPPAGGRGGVRHPPHIPRGTGAARGGAGG